jgi:hypothetical protein
MPLVPCEIEDSTHRGRIQAQEISMKKTATTLLVVAALSASTVVSLADGTYQTLPFTQNWTNIGMITANDDWSGVPGIIGYRGDDVTASTGTDPQTLTGDGTVTVDVNANIATPSTFISGGVIEAEITDPTIALQGSGTGDAPHIVLHLNTTGLQNITVSYNLRDIDASPDTARAPVALQYRIGNAGAWTNVAAGFVANAASPLPGGTLTTPVLVVLPAAVDNQAQLQVRVITSNQFGKDNMFGVDDIAVRGTPIPVATQPSTWGRIKSNYRQ